MPELPEVETVRRGLASRLKGFCIEKIQVCRERAIASPGGSREFISMMEGARIGAWERRGKYLIASLHKDFSINDQAEHTANAGLWVVHLRMTGYFKFFTRKNSPCTHTRVRIWDRKGNEIRFIDVRSFGQMWWVPPGSPPETVIKGLKNLGPEPFSENFNASYLKEILKGSKRPIKTTLLDQSIVAGAGNIYADESLFSAKINPQTPSKTLNMKKLESLCQSLINTLKISIREGGTTFSDFRDLEGVNGNYGGQAWVYRRSGEPCRKCGAKIKRLKISGRSTHWCPECQK